MTDENPIILDLRGLKCPMPALRLRKALSHVPKGARIHVTATDPMTVIDIPHLLRETGDLLMSQDRSNDTLTFYVQKR